MTSWVRISAILEKVTLLGLLSDFFRLHIRGSKAEISSRAADDGEGGGNKARSGIFLSNSNGRGRDCDGDTGIDGLVKESMETGDGRLLRFRLDFITTLRL
jgi:hypothetical protein